MISWVNFIWMKINTVNATSHILLWIFCSSNSLTNYLGRKAAPKMFWHFSYLTLLTLKNEIFIFIVSIQICLDATLPNWCLCIHALLIKSYETSFFLFSFFSFKYLRIWNPVGRCIALASVTIPSKGTPMSQWWWEDGSTNRCGPQKWSTESDLNWMVFRC